jgi:hypothetical protein
LKVERHPKSVPGDFYVENEQCLCCGVPHVIAPNLIGWVDDERSHCYWKTQPETTQELEQAISVLGARELDCHRYMGSDQAILRRIPPTCCDHDVPSEFKPAAPVDALAPHFSLRDDGSSLLVKIRNIFKEENFQRLKAL